MAAIACSLGENKTKNCVRGDQRILYSAEVGMDTRPAIVLRRGYHRRPDRIELDLAIDEYQIPI